MIDKEAIEKAVKTAKQKPAQKVYHEHDGTHPECPECCEMGPIEQIFAGDGLE